jgi:hypothetical protein
MKILGDLLTIRIALLLGTAYRILASFLPNSAQHEDLLGSRQSFGSPLLLPIVGGRDLDLALLEAKAPLVAHAIIKHGCILVHWLAQLAKQWRLVDVVPLCLFLGLGPSSGMNPPPLSMTCMYSRRPPQSTPPDHWSSQGNVK